jgi:Na+/H+-dicarboxylate symporter/ABC-type amino acid transport substrate-binding protein
MKFLSRLSPFQRVVIGLILGIFSGLFFGEVLAPLKIAGDIYIRLLQMTVLPYVLVSIIAGLGRLDTKMAGSIGSKGGLVVLFLWVATMLSVVLIPLAYPDWQSAGFFSSSLLAEPAKIDFIKMYIPYNVFLSLSETIVPAVVVFALMMGLALIHVPNKEVFLSSADAVAAALMKVASTVAKVAPFGVFAISAAAAGTIYPEELGRLQIYLWTYLSAWTVLAMVTLPLFVAWGTPFKYRPLLSTASEAMVTAIATGTVLVVLPLIVERCKEMLEEEGMGNDQTHSTVDVMVPTAYSFPSAGTLMGLGFILFSAWYIGSPLEVGQYGTYIIMGTLSAFGSMAVAIPFLLDYFGMPQDQFQLYLLGSVITARFATGLAALHGFVVTLMVASAVVGRLNWRRVFQALLVSLVLMAATMVGLGIILQKSITYSYDKDVSFESMKSLLPRVKVVKTEGALPLTAEQLSASRMKVIRERGTIRVGYTANRLPLVFRNASGQAVGYDMDLVHGLAADIGVKLEVYRVPLEELLDWMNDGRLDIIVGGWSITPDRALALDFSNAYLRHNLGLIISDSRRSEFRSLKQINARTGTLRLGFPIAEYYRPWFEKLLPGVELVAMDSPRAFLRGEMADLDGVIFSAEWGSAWTLLYPQFTIAIPQGMRIVVPMGMGLPLDDMALKRFIDTWLALKQDNGLQERLYNYWILGISEEERPPRWSIMHDVLKLGVPEEEPYPESQPEPGP